MQSLVCKSNDTSKTKSYSPVIWNEQKKFVCEISPKINLFYGYSPFSNYYKSEFDIGNRTFYSVEQFYQYSKAVTFDDTFNARRILLTKSPGKAKQLGQLIKGFNNEEWKKLRNRVMFRGLKAKFLQNAHLEHLLCEAEGILAEASATDLYWGIGLSKANPKAQQVSCDKLLW
jgi:ribA/ribD-fused uncharacterized protein